MTIEKIHEVGWRQGSFFYLDAERIRNLAETPEGLSKDELYVVVSHDCDIVNPSLVKEPIVELCPARFIGDDINGARTNAKNPRYFQMPVLFEDETVYVEVHGADRRSVDRELFSQFSPDYRFVLEENEKKQLADWIANRYSRAAFPSEFNNRLKPSLKKIAAILRTGGVVFTAFFIALSSLDELPSDQAYEIELYGCVSFETYEDPDIRQNTENILAAIISEILSCDGIKVSNFALVSERDITLEDANYLRILNFEV